MYEIIGEKEGEKDCLLGWAHSPAHALYIAWSKLRKEFPEYYLRVRRGDGSAPLRLKKENGVLVN